MFPVILFYFLIINAISFLLMLTDKHKARKNLWRIPESTLFTCALLGGSIGSLIGMYTFRHKTKHLTFTIGMPLILILQILTVIMIFFSFQ